MSINVPKTTPAERRAAYRDGLKKARAEAKQRELERAARIADELAAPPDLAGDRVIDPPAPRKRARADKPAATKVGAAG